MKTVIAVTVTYNRSDTLENTIKALTKQESNSLKKILIVDNDSNESHKAKIKEIVEISEKIELISLSENTGGAGGFYYGMKYVIDNYKYDYIWIMDDDAYPRKDCLTNLINGFKNVKSFDRNMGFVAPLAWGITNEKYQLYHHKNISRYKNRDIFAVEDVYENSAYVKIQANAFVGPLFSKLAIEKVGLPDKDLFIYGDDTEYTYRVTREHEGYLVTNAIIDHEDLPSDNSSWNPKAWWKEYYMNRNKLLFVDKYSENMFIKTIGKLSLIYKITKSMIGAIIKDNYKHYRMLRIKLLYKSLFDGLRKKSGKLIDPSEYILSVNKITNRIKE